MKIRKIIIISSIIIIVISLIFLDPLHYLKNVPLSEGIYKPEKVVLFEDQQIAINSLTIVDLTNVNIKFVYNGEELDLYGEVALGHQGFLHIFFPIEDGNGYSLKGYRRTRSLGFTNLKSDKIVNCVLFIEKSNTSEKIVELKFKRNN